jgi:hypothetical protein
MVVVANNLQERPIATLAVDEQYRRLLERGELAAEKRLASAVLCRALQARRDGATPTRSCDYEAVPPRERVFREAVDDFAPARDAARLLIQVLVQCGHDPSDPEFVPSDSECPDFGSTAMRVLGWPHEWVRPEYHEQMSRVLERHRRLREAGPRSELWYREASRAWSGFLTRGDLPDDPELQEFALVAGEMFALNADYFGRSVAGLLQAFEDVSAAAADERAAALERLGALQVRACEVWS